MIDGRALDQTVPLFHLGIAKKRNIYVSLSKESGILLQKGEELIEKIKNKCSL